MNVQIDEQTYQKYFWKKAWKFRKHVLQFCRKNIFSKKKKSKKNRENDNLNFCTCCIYVFSKRLKTLIWIHIHPRHTWRFFSSSLRPFSHFLVFCRFQWLKRRRRTTKVLLSKRHGLSSCNASLEGIFRETDGHNPNIDENSEICLRFFPKAPDFFLQN